MGRRFSNEGGSGVPPPEGLGIIQISISRSAGSISADGIVPAFMERMATAEPFEAHPYSSQRATLRYGFHHVLGAGWIVAASRGQERRNKNLVKSESGDQDCLHRANTRPISRHRSLKGASRTVRLGLNTTAQSVGRVSSRVRTAARMRRLMRFRYTAFPTARGTVNPKREGRFASSLRRQNAAK
jgi:hypothetical protein